MRSLGFGFSLLLVFLVVGLDQMGKWFVLRLGWQNVSNRGIAFGLFASTNWLFFLVLFSLLALGAAWVVRMRKETDWPSSLGLGLLVGGGVGNVLDRLIRKGVVDFLSLGFGPRFNLADAAIVGGLAVLSWPIFFGHKRWRRKG